jgi:hypothetical protein
LTFFPKHFLSEKPWSCFKSFSCCLLWQSHSLKILTHISNGRHQQRHVRRTQIVKLVKDAFVIRAASALSRSRRNGKGSSRISQNFFSLLNRLEQDSEIGISDFRDTTYEFRCDRCNQRSNFSNKIAYQMQISSDFLIYSSTINCLLTKL